MNEKRNIKEWIGTHSRHCHERIHSISLLFGWTYQISPFSHSTLRLHSITCKTSVWGWRLCVGDTQTCATDSFSIALCIFIACAHWKRWNVLEVLTARGRREATSVDGSLFDDYRFIALFEREYFVCFSIVFFLLFYSFVDDMQISLFSFESIEILQNRFHFYFWKTKRNAFSYHFGESCRTTVCFPAAE